MKKYYINSFEVSKEDFIKDLFYSLYTYSLTLDKSYGMYQNIKTGIYNMVEDTLKESSKNSGLNVKDKYFQVIDWKEEEIKEFMYSLDYLTDNQTKTLKINENINLLGENKYDENGNKSGLYVDLNDKNDKIKTFIIDFQENLYIQMKNIIEEIMKIVDENLVKE